MTKTDKDSEYGPSRRSTNVHGTSVAIPNDVWDKWQELLSRQPCSSLSSIVTATLKFGLMGPHPYSDPLDGILDAFDLYPAEKVKEGAIVVKVLKTIGKVFGVEVAVRGAR